MRGAILKKFISVLLAALFLNSLIFYVGSSAIILDNAKRDMRYILESADSLLDYGGDLSAQIQRLELVTDKNDSRITVIRADGTVAADTEADVTSLGNHSGRSEVEAAFAGGIGYSKRYSDTLKQTMLYVALRSEHSDLVLRMAVPYSGMREYLPMLFPAALGSFLFALACSAWAAKRFASSVTRPLREMSRNVKAYLSQIERERRIRQEFFSNASHELKTPITSIQGYAELLESGMIGDPAMQRDFAGRIKREAVRMTGLINDILMISRLETKEAEVVISDVRVSVLLDEILESLKPQAAAGQVFIHVDCQPLVIKANAQHMRELFTNLIGNAVKYNRPGGQVWVNVREADGRMVIRVRDNGVGIPEDSLDRIFERFYRVDKGRSRKQGGTGLGLSIVKHIVSYYHGAIRVESKLDEGSEFTVELPMGEQ